MADYDQPNYVTRRLRYFNNQYLSEQDFIDEQKYHLDRQRRHDRLLHVSGIADGLDVTAKGAVVTVAPGTAVDELGRHLLVDTAQTFTLTSEHQGTRVVYLRFQEVPSNEVVGDQGVTGHTRFNETAQLLQEAPGGAATDGRLVLAELTVAANGTVTEVKTDKRKYSGLRLAAPTGKTLTLRATNDGTRAVLDTGLSLAEPLAVGTVNAARAQLEVKAGTGRTPLRVTDVNGNDLLVLGNDSSLSLGAGDRVGKLSLGAKGSVIELGAGLAGKEGNAGKIGYQLFSDGLDIVGAGVGSNRKVTMIAEAGTTFNGPVRLLDKQVLELGAGVVGKDANNGKLGYQTFSDGLDIVGAGAGTNRKVTVYAEWGTTFNGTVRLLDKQVLELGAGVAGKEGNAGKIGYQTFSNGLDIVGAGTGADRRVTLWAEGGTNFKGPQYLSDKYIFLRSPEDKGHGLGWAQSDPVPASMRLDGPCLWGWTAGGLATASPTMRYSLSWFNDGSVKLDSNGKGDLFASGFPERVRMIRGSVNADGGIYAGSGFKVTKVANTTGLYDIVFSQAFTSVPTVVASQQYTGGNESGGDTRDNAVIVITKVGSARIKTGQADGAAANRQFHFIAVGT